MPTPPSSTVVLPAAVASYFRFEATDPEALARCFTEDGLVVTVQGDRIARLEIGP